MGLFRFSEVQQVLSILDQKISFGLALVHDERAGENSDFWLGDRVDGGLWGSAHNQTRDNL